MGEAKKGFFMWLAIYDISEITIETLNYFFQVVVHKVSPKNAHE